ncbi:hypothetical protein J1614_001455 [Plenodomus biglobosus]|nr:hypothetical protein J1614_001455 [Plenodomus biglobosus]
MDNPTPSSGGNLSNENGGSSKAMEASGTASQFATTGIAAKHAWTLEPPALIQKKTMSDKAKADSRTKMDRRVNIRTNIKALTLPSTLSSRDMTDGLATPARTALFHATLLSMPHMAPVEWNKAVRFVNEMLRRTSSNFFDLAGCEDSQTLAFRTRLGIRRALSASSQPSTSRQIE